jgi:hypothetical protein
VEELIAWNGENIKKEKGFEIRHLIKAAVSQRRVPMVL